MRISNGALCNTHRDHAAQIKLIYIDLNQGEQSYTCILLAELANSWQFFRLFTVIQKLFEFFFNYKTIETNIFFLFFFYLVDVTPAHTITEAGFCFVNEVRRSKGSESLDSIQIRSFWLL